ncbi:MAG: PAS domain S-box protein [Burkholderiales bacterium]|nr:PAS domain S-box protein [Burkholderiales bacterium]
MRKNLPITQREQPFDPKRPIVSMTDLKGTIRHANQAFINVSGFSIDELIGQPHNIVRHPDMPQEAFDDMWRTISADLPWRGLVKNRTKTGDYYWVDAYVTPVFEGGQKVGYMSVRRSPMFGQVEQAESLYAAVREGRAEFPRTEYRRLVPLTARLALAVGVPALCTVGALLTGGVLGWGIGAAGVVVGVGAAAWTALGIRAPLVRATESLFRIAQGELDFDIDATAPGEFALLLICMQAMQINLRAMLTDVVAITNDVDEQSRQLNEQVESVTQRIHEGADSVSSVAASIEEMSTSVREISASTNQSADHATAAVGLVGEGVDQLVATLAASQEVVNSVHSAQALIIELQTEVASIQGLASSIKEIADQTNLLALNAAIEAARAGESGRGFAVVADEVRKLAERTAISTIEIASTVERIGACTANTLTAMSDAAHEVAHSDTLMNQSRQTLDAIKASADDIQASSRGIATMLQQQDQASSEVAVSVERISQLAEQNSGSIDSIRDAAALLGSTAYELKLMTQRFEKSL